MTLDEGLVKFDIHWVVKEYPTFDSFMDWLDIDVGISKEKMLDTYKVVADKFEMAGYGSRALLIRLKMKKIRDEDI